ncbi:MAG: YkgJ family cysteine cluster protein [Thermodesulfobacteriota bacterium]
MHSNNPSSTTEAAIPRCRRCGTCCRKGGPALHRQDLPLLVAGHIGHSHLLTVRRGEPVIPPFAEEPEPAGQELVKIAGSTGWTCRFFREGLGCSLYRHRPVECRTLFCADPAPLLALIGRETLNRLDLINPDDPVRAFIARQETDLPLSAMMERVAALRRRQDAEQARTALTAMINDDIRLREEWLRQGGQRCHELFLFGRPLFLVLTGMGMQVKEDRGVLSLSPAGSGNDRSR